MMGRLWGRRESRGHVKAHSQRGGRYWGAPYIGQKEPLSQCEMQRWAPNSVGRQPFGAGKSSVDAGQARLIGRCIALYCAFGDNGPCCQRPQQTELASFRRPGKAPGNTDIRRT